MKTNEVIVGLRYRISGDLANGSFITHEDVVRIKKTTKSLAKAIKLQAKLANDCGRFLSDTVRIVAVRFYKNGKFVKELRAEVITGTYNG